jgi:hypothetical protein
MKSVDLPDDPREAVTAPSRVDDDDDDQLGSPRSLFIDEDYGRRSSSNRALCFPFLRGERTKVRRTYIIF